MKICWNSMKIYWGAKVRLNLCKTHEKIGVQKCVVKHSTRCHPSPHVRKPKREALGAHFERQATQLRPAPRWDRGAVWTPLKARDLVGSCVGDPTTMRDYGLLPRMNIY